VIGFVILSEIYNTRQFVEMLVWQETIGEIKVTEYVTLDGNRAVSRKGRACIGQRELEIGQRVAAETRRDTRAADNLIAFSAFTTSFSELL